MRQDPSRFPKRASVFKEVKSRMDLLIEESHYYDKLKNDIIKQRRTKILATLSENYCDYEKLKSFCTAGMDAILVNMAYCS